MPKPEPLEPATDMTEALNIGRLRREGIPIGRAQSRTSDLLRKELAEKGLKGFKKGGKVKKTGPAKLHKGERVLTAKTAKKMTPAKLRAAVRKPTPRRRPR